MEIKDVVISKLNETWMKVETPHKHIEFEISDRFSFEVPNAKFDPRVRARRWDGIKRLYNRQHKRMHSGLLLELLKLLNKSGYSYDVDPDLLSFGDLTMEDVKDIIKEAIDPHDNGNPIEPYDYQYEAILHQLNSSRSIVLAATAAGKSLVLYITTRIYQLMDSMDNKNIFIIVPSKMLVEQMYADFANYSKNSLDNWNVDTHCQRINGDYDKNIRKQIVITTWQSLVDIPKYKLESAGAIFVDEVHRVKGPVLAKLLESALYCPIRHGVTGTLDGMEVNELAAQGLFGPVKKIVSAKELIQSGRATPININIAIFDYSKEIKKDYHDDQKNAKQTMRYHSEVNFINNIPERFEMINNIAFNLKGNTIVLFDRVEDYGIPLYEDMKSRMLDSKDKVFLITGDVKSIERESIRLNLENIDSAIVYATSAIMSTGVSIKNLHNAIFVSSTKSKVKILQSIGRLMRLHDSKKSANLIDIVDKLDYNGKPNYALSHIEERVKHYSKEGHKIKFQTFNLGPSKPEVTLC